MDFGLTDEQRLILGTVREFVTKELLPLEAEAQRAELDGRTFPGPTDIRRLQQRAKTAGLSGPREGAAVEFGALRLRLQRQQLLGHEFADGSQDQALFVGKPEVHLRFPYYLPPFHAGGRAPTA